jgi:CspA family cold shock protein
MNFRDTLVTCKECGKQFVFTVETQRQMIERGLEVVPPDTCTTCLQRINYGGRFHGRIKWFSTEKGYGFILGDGGNEVFVHRNGIAHLADGTLPILEEQQEVLYDVSDTPKGPQAVKVTPYPGQPA